MSHFKQGPEPEFDPDLNLRDALLDLRRHEPTWPPKASMMTFARDSLGIQPEDEDTWYQSAWWGYYASRLLDWYRREHGLKELQALVEPVDWSPLDKLLEDKRGVILTVSHLGPGFIPGMAVKAAKYPALAIRGGTSAHRVQSAIPVHSEADRKQALTRALLHLRRGNIIVAAPDGSRHGADSLRARFLNQSILLSTGVGELARISNAQTCRLSATWMGQARIRLIIEPIPSPTQEGRDQWLRQWHVAYLHRMARQINHAPRDIGFQFGLWGRSRGGVVWYEAQDEYPVEKVLRKKRAAPAPAPAPAMEQELETL